MSYESLIVTTESDGRILNVKLNRPEVRNAFNGKVIEELAKVFNGPALGKGKGYENIRLIYLSGEGKAFCGGGDLNWMKSGLDLTEEENFKDCQRLTRMFLAMDRCPKPLIGIVHGAAIGGGVGLVSVCDHIVAEENTVFSLSEVKLGLVPACIGPFVLSKVGMSNARSLFLSGERMKAKKAQTVGLVHDVTSEKDLWVRTQQLGQQILEGGPFAIAIAKNLLHTLDKDLRAESLEKQLDFAAAELAKLRVGDEGQEGVRAFLEKRAPSWRS